METTAQKFENWANEILENELINLKVGEFKQRVFDRDEENDADALEQALKKILNSKEFSVTSYFDQWRWYIVQIKCLQTTKNSQRSRLAAVLK